MRAVWSFWSKPFFAGKGNLWGEPLHHWLAWGLSLRQARKHHAETVLVTDLAGRELLVDCLGLQFTQVSTELESIRKADAEWWALGKLVAYSIQEHPFVHLDTDVFLWKPLPSGAANAPVFGQYLENYHSIDQWWGPRTVEQTFDRHNLVLPAEWHAGRSASGDRFSEINCGILGGNDTSFLRYFSELAIDLILNPINAPVWAELHDLNWFNHINEQFFLAACIDYHRSNPASPYRGVHCGYLFQTIEEAFDSAHAARVGFTHLLGDAKRNRSMLDRLQQRVQAEDLSFYRNCLQLTRSLERDFATAAP